jgi:4-hydroxy-tetrahydrodipicolinate reductase
MTTKLTIVGAAGRMGQALLQCSAHVSGIDIVGAVEREAHPDLGKDSGAVAEVKQTGVPLTTDLQKALGAADVLVDFTNASSVLASIRTAAAAGTAVVTGTTGLSDSESASLQEFAQSIPIVSAPNMSLGVNLLFAFVERAASILGPGYVVEIDETHHIHKKDAPSGTALRLGEKVAAGKGMDFDAVMVHDPEGQGDKHCSSKIVVRSHRQGEILGDHTVSFQNQGEKIEFTHHVCSRDALALGALQAAQWVVGQKPGLYSMQDVLGL